MSLKESTSKKNYSNKSNKNSSNIKVATKKKYTSQTGKILDLKKLYMPSPAEVKKAMKKLSDRKK